MPTHKISAVLIHLALLSNLVFAAPLTEEENLIDAMNAFSDYYNAGEFGDYFEGDMLLSPSQEQRISEAKDARNGLLGANKRWPDNTVVYHIETDDFDDDQVKVIEEGMVDIANNSCIKFRPRKSEDEHAVLIQVLNLSKGCFRHGTVVHEMLHTLGFYHMQSTYDRDEFVTIIWENIKSGTEHNFAKYTNDTVTDFGVEYDYSSVMHYPETAFSVNGNKTIVPLQENVKIGQRDGMSESDILKLRKMYCESSA